MSINELLPKMRSIKSYGILTLALVVIAFLVWGNEFWNMRHYEHLHREYFIWRLLVWLGFILTPAIVGITFSRIIELINLNKPLISIISLSLFLIAYTYHMANRYESPKPDLKWIGAGLLLLAMLSAMRIKSIKAAWSISFLITLGVAICSAVLEFAYRPKGPFSQYSDFFIILFGVLLTMFPYLICKTFIQPKIQE